MFLAKNFSKNYRKKQAEGVSKNVFKILKFRAESVKVFLDRLDQNVLQKGIMVNVKVAYFTEDDHSTTNSENELKEYLKVFQNKYKYLKFQFIQAEGQFSRGRGQFFYLFLRAFVELLCGTFAPTQKDFLYFLICLKKF